MLYTQVPLLPPVEAAAYFGYALAHNSAAVGSTVSSSLKTPHLEFWCIRLSGLGDLSHAVAV